jgi:probable phosphoglycerate mutase
VDTKKTIYLIRHGQTDFNKNGIIQGSGIDSSLNAHGHAQAKAFFDNYRHVPLDNIYTSELQRTQQSVAPFQQLGFNPTPLRELNEINWGIYEGEKPTPQRFEKYVQIIKDWENGLLDREIEGGESALALFQRQQKGLNYILNRKHESTILICMHGRAMRSFLCLLTGIPLQKMEDFPHSNLCLYVLRQTDESTFRIIEQNSTKHLDQILKAP